MRGAVAVYGAALRRAVRGQEAALRLMDDAGQPVARVDAAWYTHLRPGDAGLLERCADHTIDLGCGPGRLAAALSAVGHTALGVDISPQAVRYARQRGATTLLGCVFDPLPAEGAWQRALLADGNIGIGGDPVRLLRRCRELLAHDGEALVEVDPPGTHSWSGTVTVTDGARSSEPFAWSLVSLDDIVRLAERAAMRPVETWTEADRWFVRLTLA